MSQSGGGTGNEFGARDVGLAMQAHSITVHGGIHQHRRTRKRPVPRQLPAPTMFFTDRELSLKALAEERARADARGVPFIAVCTGPGGIGKSELAYRWLQTITDEIPGPHLYADMGEGGPRTAADVLGGFLRALGEEPEDIPVHLGEMSGLFRSLTHREPVVMLLDNVTLASQVRPLLPNSPGNVMLITSRTWLAPLSAVEIPVGEMTDDDAVRLLRDVAGDDRIAAESAVAEMVLRLCRGYPLMLYSAGRQLAHRPAGLLSRERQPQERGRSGGDLGEGLYAVVAVFNAGYAELSGRAAALYRALGALLGPEFSVDMAAAVAAEDEVVPLLAELDRAGLVTKAEAGRYRMHDLGREHAREKSTPAEHEAALRRLVEWYLHTAVAADLALMPRRWRLGRVYQRRLESEFDPVAARNWLERERPALRAAVWVAADRGWADLVVELVEAQWALCLRFKDYEHWIDVHRRGVAMSAYASDRRFEGRMRCQLGFAYLEVGRLDDAAAEFAAARRADEAAGHVRGQATAVESLGLLALRRCGAEDLPALRTENSFFARQALDLLTENLRLNLTISREHDDRALALAWRHLGRAYSANGDHDAAVDHLSRARERFAAVPDPYNEGKTLIDLAQAYLRAERFGEAAESLAGALRLLAEQDYPADRATALEVLSLIAERSGDHKTAVERLSAALVLLEGRGGPRAVSMRERLARLTDRE